MTFNSVAKDLPKVTLRDKIGQMLLIGFDGKTINSHSKIVKQIEKDNIGGVILFDYNYRTETYDKNIASPMQVKQLNSDLQYFTAQSNLKHHRSNLPLLISIDYEGGKVNRLSEEYGFPPTLSAAEVGARSLNDAESTAASMAHTLKAAGFNLNFAPVLDVNINSENPIIGKLNRSFSRDTTLVNRYASIYTHQFLKHKIQCVYKHFPGHGNSTEDSHLGFVDVSNTWNIHELEPYQQLLSSHESCGVVMSAHIVNRQLDETGLPATLSYQILTGILRHQLHFKGVIITDDMEMKAISANYKLEDALVLSINAGADMFIFGNNLSYKPYDPKHLIDIIEAKVLAGDISPKRINEAYQYIMTLKESL
jgi:beta-N-acetylhexosaminidase